MSELSGAAWVQEKLSDFWHGYCGPQASAETVRRLSVDIWHYCEREAILAERTAPADSCEYLDTETGWCRHKVYVGSTGVDCSCPQHMKPRRTQANKDTEADHE